jgi:transcription-repair coupling factor (superfamily II helicase)
MDLIEKEIPDRFGKIPQPVQVLLAVTRIRIEAEYHQILSVASEGPLLRLKKSGSDGSYVKIGSRFPRLTRKKPLSRLAEIHKMIACL